jgi:hypothetical protein
LLCYICEHAGGAATCVFAQFAAGGCGVLDLTTVVTLFHFTSQIHGVELNCLLMIAAIQYLWIMLFLDFC